MKKEIEVIKSILNLLKYFLYLNNKNSPARTINSLSKDKIVCNEITKVIK
jgi:hypothetical protein